MKKIPFPTDVDLALTGRCNLRCKHCNTADTWNLENELSLAEIFDVLDQLKDLKIYRLALFGGEPFSHSQASCILEKINEYPFQLSILTNGTLISQPIIDTLKKMRFLKNIQISLDGSCPEIHDWQRGEGSFAKTLAGIKLLFKNNLPFTLKAIINKHNYEDIENMVLFARGLGLDGMDFGDAVECGSAHKYKRDICLDGNIYRESFSALLNLRKKYPELSFGGTFGQMLDMLREFYQDGPGKGYRGNFNTCGAAHNMISIRSDGEVVPCTGFWTLKCGNTREKSLREIWDTSLVFKELRQLENEPLGQFENCRKCDYVSFCNGGCRAAAYYASGNNLRGINPKTCVVFSSWMGERLLADHFDSLICKTTN